MIETLGDARRGARPTRTEKEARECPFAVGAVPNRTATGEIDPKYPIALSRAACSSKCALYDAERDMNCEDVRREKTDLLIEAIKSLKKE